MDLQAFSVCQGCCEVFPSARYCPHCAADGLAAPAAAPAAPAAESMTDLPEAAPERGSAWLAAVAVAGLALALIAAAASV